MIPQLNRILPCLSLLAAGMLAASAPAARAEAWDTIQSRNVQALGDRELAAWAIELAGKSEPIDTDEALARLDLFLRAGHRDGVRSMFAALRKLIPAPAPETPARLAWSSRNIDDKGLEAGGRIACLRAVAWELKQRQAWVLLQEFLERFPEVIDFQTLDLEIAWLKQGWSNAQVDAWLGERAAAYPVPWTLRRIEWRRRQGMDPTPLLDPLEAAVREDPASYVKARLLRDAVMNAASQKFPQQRALNWLGEICRPADYLDSLELAHALSNAGATSGALALYEATLKLPLTDQDIRNAGHMVQQQAQPSPNMRNDGQYQRERLERELRFGMLECYKKLGRDDQAAALAKKLAEDEPNTLETRVRLASRGGTESVNAARSALEAEILAKEAASAGDPEYWLTRAHFYDDQSNSTAAATAYEQALKLAPPQLQPRGKAMLPIRGRIVQAYGRSLMQAKKPQEARDLYLAELTTVDPKMDGPYAAVWGLCQLDHEPGMALDPKDPLLWAFLAKSDPWEYNQERLARTMLGRTTDEARPAFWDRLESLAATGEATRDFVVGKLLAENQQEARAIPHLRQALEKLDKSDHETTRRLLFEAYIHQGDWRQAEALTGRAGGSLTPDFWQWTLLAQAAAKNGAPEDAVRFWRRRANLDVSNLEGLAELAATPAREALRTFYQDWAQRDPASWAPAEALKMLGGGS